MRTMSAALVRRGLELLSADLPEGPDAKKKQQKKMKDSGSKKRLSRVPPVGHKRASVKDRRMRSALEEAKKGQKKDHTAVNLQYFLHSGSIASGDHTTKIVHQNSGRQSRSSVALHVEKPQESQSVFSEEEFQQFQREYFGRTTEKQ